LIPIKTEEASVVWSPCFKSTEEMYITIQNAAPSTNIGFIRLCYTHEFTIKPAFAGIITTASAEPSTREIELVAKMLA